MPSVLPLKMPRLLLVACVLARPPRLPRGRLSLRPLPPVLLRPLAKLPLVVASGVALMGFVCQISSNCRCWFLDWWLRPSAALLESIKCSKPRLKCRNSSLPCESQKKRLFLLFDFILSRNNVVSTTVIDRIVGLEPSTVLIEYS